ncbi:MAG: hypothetical protein QG563_380 [Patescibacteria group bacterium]|nr:hypothetical protein [Patescibacteria group bacterium]
MRYIKMSIPWCMILMTHAPVLILIVYMTYVFSGGEFHQKTHTTILLADALVLGVWNVCGQFARIEKVYTLFSVVTLVLLCLGLCAISAFEITHRVIFLSLYAVSSIAFFVVHCVKRIIEMYALEGQKT